MAFLTRAAGGGFAVLGASAASPSHDVVLAIIAACGAAFAASVPTILTIIRERVSKDPTTDQRIDDAADRLNELQGQEIVLLQAKVQRLETELAKRRAR